MSGVGTKVTFVAVVLHLAGKSGRHYEDGEEEEYGEGEECEDHEGDEMDPFGGSEASEQEHMNNHGGGANTEGGDSNNVVDNISDHVGGVGCDQVFDVGDAFRK